MTPEQEKSTRRRSRPSTQSFEPRRLSIEPDRWESSPQTLADIKLDWNAAPGRGRRLRDAYFRAKGVVPDGPGWKRVRPEAVLEGARRAGLIDHHLQRLTDYLRRQCCRPFRCWKGQRLIGY